MQERSKLDKILDTLGIVNTIKSMSQAPMLKFAILFTIICTMIVCVPITYYVSRFIFAPKDFAGVLVGLREQIKMNAEYQVTIEQKDRELATLKIQLDIIAKEKAELIQVAEQNESAIFLSETKLARALGIIRKQATEPVSGFPEPRMDNLIEDQEIEITIDRESLYETLAQGISEDSPVKQDLEACRFGLDAATLLAANLAKSVDDHKKLFIVEVQKTDNLQLQLRAMTDKFDASAVLIKSMKKRRVRWGPGMSLGLGKSLKGYNFSPTVTFGLSFVWG